MNTFNTIRTVATVEMRLLLRSRLFRIGAAIVTAVITFFHIIDIIAVFNPFVYFSLRDISFLFGHLMVIPASVPYENVILSTIGISIVLVLLAASSIRRERTMDTRAAIHVKEMTNTAGFYKKNLTVRMAEQMEYLGTTA